MTSRKISWTRNWSMPSSRAHALDPGEELRLAIVVAEEAQALRLDPRDLGHGLQTLAQELDESGGRPDRGSDERRPIHSSGHCSVGFAEPNADRISVLLVRRRSMNKFRISITTAPRTGGRLTPGPRSRAASKKDDKSVSISESKDGDGLVVAVSEALARSLLEGMVGADLEVRCRSRRRLRRHAREARSRRSGQPSHHPRRGRSDSPLVVRAAASRWTSTTRMVAADSRSRCPGPWPSASSTDRPTCRPRRTPDRSRSSSSGSEGGSFEFKID